MTATQFSDFLITCLTQLATFSLSGSVHFVCMDFRHMRELLSAGDKVYDSLFNLCVWVKNAGGMGSFTALSMSSYSCLSPEKIRTKITFNWVDLVVIGPMSGTIRTRTRCRERAKKATFLPCTLPCLPSAPAQFAGMIHRKFILSPGLLQVLLRRRYIELDFYHSVNIDGGHRCVSLSLYGFRFLYLC
jgi:hypothetical protein